MKIKTHTRKSAPSGRISGIYAIRGRYILFLALITAIIHLPALWLGPIHDDFHVLGKCEDFPFSTLISEGFKFTSDLLGNPWWIEKKIVAQYFRPLLLLTYKIPIMISGKCYGLQHLVNILLQILNVSIIYLLGRKFFRSPTSAFFTAAFFAASVHCLVPVQWIVSRKELLTDAFLMGAFWFHMQTRLVCSTSLFSAALLSGEHAVAFPLITIFWDIMMPKTKSNSNLGMAVTSGNRLDRQENPTQSGFDPTSPHYSKVTPLTMTASNANYKSFALYLAILGLYFLLRSIALNGFPLPVEPYFTNPCKVEFLTYFAWKILLYYFSLIFPVGFVDRVLVILWIDHPLLFIGCLSAIVGILWAQFHCSRDKRLWIIFQCMAFLSFLPFTPMFATPFYLYTPFIFFSLSMGISFDGIIERSISDKTLYDKMVLYFLIFILFVNGTASLISSWGPWKKIFTIPQQITPKMVNILKTQPYDRKIFFIDVPIMGLNFFTLVAAETHRDMKNWAVLTGQSGIFPHTPATVQTLESGKYEITAGNFPYFCRPVERMACFVPDGKISLGTEIDKDWYSVKIVRLGSDSYVLNRGHPAFSMEKGVAALRIQTKPGISRPLIIGFNKFEPEIILDPQ